MSEPTRPGARTVLLLGVVVVVAVASGAYLMATGERSPTFAERTAAPTTSGEAASPVRPPASRSATPSASPARKAGGARHDKVADPGTYRAGVRLADPAADPGMDPVFASDPDLRRSEVYSYRFSRPGDHRLAAGTYAFQYDVTAGNLRADLAGRRSALASATGIALYLTGGTALTDADLAALQNVHRDLGLTGLSRLYVYNLKTIQGGRECTPDSGLACAGQTARGGLFPYLWFNGWWDTWVRQLILDDLTAVPDGAFSNHNFAEVSLRGARSIGVMGFGHGPHARWNVLYLPSVRTIAHDAFRRNQGLQKINLPRVTRVDDYAFDDATSLRYINAPPHGALRA